MSMASSQPHKRRLTACFHCRYKRVACKFDIGSIACRSCLKSQVSCTGPVKVGKTSRSKGRHGLEILNLLPTTSSGLLVDFTLTCALSFRLIDAYVKVAGQRLYIGSGLQNNSLVSVFRTIGGDTRLLEDFDEVLALAAMQQGAQFVVHSAFFGHHAALVPSFEDYTTSSRHREDLHHFGLRRVPALVILAAKVFDKIRKLSWENLPLSEAAQRISVISLLLSEIVVTGVVLPRDDLLLTRDLLGLAALFLLKSSNDSAANRSLRETVASLAYREKILSFSTGTPSTIRRVKRPLKLPNLYSFTPEDIDFVLTAIPPPEDVGARQAKMNYWNGFLSRWCRPTFSWKDALLPVVSDTLDLEDAEAAYNVCADAAGLLFAHNDFELAKIFEDERYWVTHHSANVVGDVVRFTFTDELVVLNTFLVLYARMETEREECQQMWHFTLNRIVHQCERLRNLAQPYKNVLSWLKALSTLAIAVSTIPQHELLIWTTHHRRQNTSLIESLLPPSFCYPVAAKMVERLRNAASVVHVDARKMVDGAVAEIYATSMVSSALLSL